MTLMVEPQFEFGVAVTPSDVTTYPQGISVYVGGAGNVTVVTFDGTSLLFTAPPVGSLLPMRVKKVMSTGTSATALIGMW